MFNASDEPNIALVENRSPLHGRAVQHLADGAVTDLGIDRVGADFVLHRFAVAASAVLRDEALVLG
jgi:hypothetical protein